MANTSGPQATIGNSQTMNADAAKYFNALRRDVQAATGVAVIATEGTRTWERQNYLYVNRNEPGFNPAWPPNSPYAYHMSGRAVDVGSGVGYVNTAVSKDFYGRAGAFGFKPTIEHEPWHFEWRLEWVRPDIRARVESVNTAPSNPGTPTAPIRTDDEEMISPEAQQFISTTVSNAVATILDGIRRDGRYRIYKNRETGEYKAINWDMPSDDPARVIYPNDEAHLARMFDPYQLVGDKAAQAKVVEPFEFESLGRLADGTDVAYKKDKSN